jgi:hypothetical protein
LEPVGDLPCLVPSHGGQKKKSMRIGEKARAMGVLAGSATMRRLGEREGSVVARERKGGAAAREKWRRDG